MRCGVTIFLIAISWSSYCQPGFQNLYGGEGFQIGLACDQTNDGGFVFFGLTDLQNGNGSDMLLIRADALGNELWTKTYETNTSDIATSIIQVSDGGFVLCGSTGFSQDSLTVIRTDPVGEIIWQRKFLGWGCTVGQHVILANNGDILVTGFTGGGEEEDVMLVRLDPNGGTVWTRVHDRPGRQFTRRILAMDDGGFAYFGTTGGFSGDMLLVRTDQTGDTLWTKIIGTPVAEQGNSLALTSDGGFILVGQEYFPSGDIILMKADANGETEWTELHGGDGWDHAVDVITTEDGYAIAGRKEIGNGDHHLYFIRTDLQGVLQWENTYAMHEMSDAYDLEGTVDGGYIILGNASVIEPLTADFYAVKIDANGFVSTPENEMSESITAYPNPFNVDVQISVQGHEDLDMDLDLTLKDALGKTVRVYRDPTACELVIYREDLASGAYFLHWSHKGKFLDHLKLIVQ